MHCSETSCNEHDSEPTNGHENKRRRTPLPWAQLLVVHLIQFSEPITATVIYPFINQFVLETGITGGDERKTGYFAGMIESTFFLAEAATVVFWGMASDRFGRRPVLLFGPLGLSLVMVSFGMTTAFPWLVVFRLLQGVFNGNIGVSKAVIGELTDSTNMADAFARIPLMWCMGITLGPIIGGLLSRPAERWPDSLGKLPYLKIHPYFLPCLAAAMVAFISFLGGFVALKETSPAIRSQRERNQNAQRDRRTRSLVSDSFTPLADSNGTDYGTHRSLTPSSNSSASLTKVEDGVLDAHGEHQKPPPFRTLLTPELITLLVNYSLFTFLDMSMQVLLPLMWSTSVEHGGLGFTPYLIGITMGVNGMFSALVQLSLLGPIIRRYGARKVYIVTFSCLLVPFSCYPITSYLAQRTGQADWKVWCVIVVQLAASAAVPACYGSVQVMVQDLSPSKSALGATNGLAQAVSSASRGLGPWVASSLYAISLQRHLARGNAVYYILLAIVAGGIRLSFTLPKQFHLALAL